MTIRITKKLQKELYNLKYGECVIISRNGVDIEMCEEKDGYVYIEFEESNCLMLTKISYEEILLSGAESIVVTKEGAYYKYYDEKKRIGSVEYEELKLRDKPTCEVCSSL